MRARSFQFSIICGVGVIGLAIAVLLGWELNVTVLKSIFPGFVPTVPWTAMALLSSGVALLGAALRDYRVSGRWVQGLGAFAAGAIASVFLLEYVTGADWGFDRALFGSALAQLDVRFPGRMAGAAAVLFLILALALLTDGLTRRAGRAYSVLASAGLFMSCLPILGYAFSAEPLYTSIPYSSMALPTAVGLAILFAGTLAARPSDGWVALLQSDSLGGMTARGLLPVVVGVPLTLAIVLLWVSRLTHMEPDFRLAVVTVTVIGVLLAVVLRNARRIEQLDRERQAAASALATAKDEAEAANLAKSTFLANMSHELRTPLTAILGFSQLLEMGQDDKSSEDRLCIDHILKNGKHLLALINDVLDLAKIDAGHMSTSPERIVLSELLVGLEASLSSLADTSGVTIVVHACADVPDVRADLTRLNQVLLNLGTNAIKYNRAGGRVDITCERVGQEWLRLTVADTGLGIPESRQSQLFEPFNRLGREAGAIEGTGIGLALSRRLMQLMGGKIGFSSRQGEGSVFWIELPTYAHPTGHVSVSSVADAEGTWEAESGADIARRLVLCVDDNRAGLDLVAKLVGAIPGTSLLTAMTAEEGLELARSRRPNLILMDINMPGKNGLAALAELRSHEKTRDIPVFALSAAATTADIDKGLAAGFERYLTKPFDVRELMGAVRERLTRTAG